MKRLQECYVAFECCGCDQPFDDEPCFVDPENNWFCTACRLDRERRYPQTVGTYRASMFPKVVAKPPRGQQGAGRVRAPR